jgi:chromate transporter|nr:chromate transporter [uncultured Noviherbaspirillum sp.]
MTALLQMHPLDWLNLFVHYLGLSLMAIGGAITTAPDMHRYLVEEQHWMTDSQFNASITLAQAAPGPNVLFVALMGWQVGLNAGSLAGAMLGVAITMTGMLLPSATLTYVASRWGHNNRELRSVRAFKQGMAPVVVGLILATGWLMSSAHGEFATDWRLWLVTAVTALVVWKTRVHLLWLLGAGGLLGWFGWV